MKSLVSIKNTHISSENYFLNVLLKNVGAFAQFNFSIHSKTQIGSTFLKFKILEEKTNIYFFYNFSVNWIIFFYFGTQFRHWRQIFLLQLIYIFIFE